VALLTEGTLVHKPHPSHPSHHSSDGDGFSPQVFNTIGTLVDITEFSTPQAGLLLIQCTGLQRFAIDRHEKFKHGLWVADVTFMAADQAVPIRPELKQRMLELDNPLVRLELVGDILARTGIAT